MVFVVEGMDVSRVRVNRSDVEALEHAPDGADRLLARAVVEDSAARPRSAADRDHGAGPPAFTWGISPYIETALFDPETRSRGDIGVRAEARYEFGGGFVAEGEIRARVAGNLDEPQVRWTRLSRLAPTEFVPTPTSTTRKAMRASSG